MRRWMLSLPLSSMLACSTPKPAPPVTLATVEVPPAQPGPPAPPAGPVRAATCGAGNADACAEDGLALAKSGKQAEAVALYRRACDGGSARGCAFLGDRLRDGRGIDQDVVRAVAAYERGCDRGAMDACQSLGTMYAIGGAGDGTETGSMPVDLARSFQFHKRACDGGLADGCLSVAFMYEHGEHVAADVARAAALYRKACDDGSGDACYGLSLLHAEGRGVPKDEASAAELVERGCRANGAFSCVELAKRFERSQGDPCCTFAFLLRACKRRHREACMVVTAGGGAGFDGAVAAFHQQCEKSSFASCEFVKGDRY